MVLAVPELGGNEDILTLNVELLEGALDTDRDFLLVLVDGSQIQVTVTGLQGLVDSFADLTGGRLPGTESQGAVRMVSVDIPSSIGFHVNIRNFSAGVEGNLLAERHDDSRE